MSEQTSFVFERRMESPDGLNDFLKGAHRKLIAGIAERRRLGIDALTHAHAGAYWTIFGMAQSIRRDIMESRRGDGSC